MTTGVAKSRHNLSRRRLKDGNGSTDKRQRQETATRDSDKSRLCAAERGSNFSDMGHASSGICSSLAAAAAAVAAIQICMLPSVSAQVHSSEVRRAPELGEDCYMVCCGNCRVQAFCAFKGGGLGVASTGCVVTTPTGVGGFCCSIFPGSDSTVSATTVAASTASDAGRASTPAAPTTVTTSALTLPISMSSSIFNVSPSSRTTVSRDRPYKTLVSPLSISTETTSLRTMGDLSQSPEATEAYSPSLSGHKACLSLGLLFSIPRRDLVHSTHHLSAVLCLTSHPWACATKTHGVMVSSVKMRMSDACGRSGRIRCFSAVRAVNNAATHVHGADVVRVGGVGFTHYDARYPERVQRAVHWVRATWWT
jgi:hypothetical protein